MTRFVTPLLGALVLGAALPSIAQAELRVSGVWGGVFSGPGHSAITIEFDTATNRVDISGTYMNQSSELTDVVFEYVDGSEILMLLDHDSGVKGFTHGSMFLDEPDAAAILAGELQLRMVSVDPNLSGGTRVVHFDDTVNQSASAQHPTIAGAFSTAFGFTDGTGGAILNFSAQGYADDVTRVEFFRDAWIGEQGISAGTATRFAGGEWWVLQLPEISHELYRDFRDGLTYVEIATGSEPSEVLRMQLHDGFVGTEYCLFNSTDSSLPFGGSQVQIEGSPRLGAGPLTLKGRWLPPSTFVIPLVARSNRHRTAVPFTSSVMCLGGGAVGRLASGVGMTTTGGVFEATLDPMAMPTPGGPVAAIPGEQWNVQLWYRDVQDGGLVQSNFSSAVRLELR